jgi:methionyl-tRNA formyltransferase
MYFQYTAVKISLAPCNRHFLNTLMGFSFFILCIIIINSYCDFLQFNTIYTTEFIKKQMAPKKIKIVFVGTPEFALAPLISLITHENFEVQAVITQEDKRIGRKQILTPPPVKILAQKYSIPVLQPPDIKNKEIYELLKELSPDFIVVSAYGQILSQSILDIPKYGCINTHASLLPYYRGASPIEEALLNGDKETGVTFMKMVKKMDSGPIIHIERVPIAPCDTAKTLREKLATVAGSLIHLVLADMLDGLLSPIPQDETKATYCHKIYKKDGLIDLKKETAEDIKNKIRAFTPWPSCFIDIKGKKLKLIEAEVYLESKAKPEEVVWLKKDQIGIGTKKGLIIPKKVQLEGKNPLLVQDFLRGNKDLLLSKTRPTNPK